MNDALRAALGSSEPAPTQSEVSSALYAIARDCGWTISSFHWRPIYCTFHLCFAATSQGPIAIVAGADARVLALSRTSNVGDELDFIDDAAFSSASSGYAPGMQVLLAAHLKADLSESDRSWLINLNPDMDYNLKYWRPETAGEVIFNTWD